MPTPKYKVRPDTGELQEYIFEYNGILALKNFVARVDGERLILHSAEDMNFSILDALVSEVEINGVVYDNADAAQQALQRLTFNTNRPVIMTQRERDLLLGALQSDNYVGTAADLKSLIDGKVDKVPGKILSSNDFTNELRAKLEGLQNVDISQLLPKGGYTGTAQNLKELIDNIMRILQSPDTELDELREIVAYIKQNKRTLDTLGINNIAGLQDALNGKAPTDHNHDDRYSRLGHTHTEYAPLSHRHNWNDIDGKPEIATEEKIQEAVRKIQIGGRNLIKETANFSLKESPYYLQSNYTGNGGYVDETFRGNKVIKLIYNWQGIQCRTTFEDRPMIISFWAKTSKTGVKFTCITDSNVVYSNGTEILSDGEWHRYTISKNSRITTFSNGNNGFVEFYKDNGHIEEVYVSSFKIEYGNIPTDWSPAPEDIRIATEISETRQIFPHENIVYVTANVPNCDLQLIPSGYSVAFRKVFAGGNVTFTCSGKQIIYTGDTAFNGGDGSTAVVSIWNNKCYIDIRNI